MILETEKGNEVTSFPGISGSNPKVIDNLKDFLYAKASRRRVVCGGRSVNLSLTCNWLICTRYRWVPIWLIFCPKKHNSELILILQGPFIDMILPNKTRWKKRLGEIFLPYLEALPACQSWQKKMPPFSWTASTTGFHASTCSFLHIPGVFG